MYVCMYVYAGLSTCTCTKVITGITVHFSKSTFRVLAFNSLFVFIIVKTFNHLPHTLHYTKCSSLRCKGHISYTLRGEGEEGQCCSMVGEGERFGGPRALAREGEWKVTIPGRAGRGCP